MYVFIEVNIKTFSENAMLPYILDVYQFYAERQNVMCVLQIIA